MAYPVYLGSFKKRINSTKQPDYSQWQSYNIVLKQAPLDYDRPTILIEAEFAALAPQNLNYAVMFGRFYWITGMRAVRTNLTEIDMAFDILASNREEILNTKAFIEYGFNTFDAGDASSRIADSRRAVSRNPSIYSSSVDPSGGIISPQTGVYIMQAVGNNPNGAHKGLATFALTAAQLRSIISQVNSDLAQDIDNILDQYDPTADPPDKIQELMLYLQGFSLKNSLLNEDAMAAIQSVKWLPLDISGSSGSLQTLYLGNYSTGIPAALLNSNSIYSHTSSISIPWPVSDWRRANSQLVLYLPFFGTIPVPVDQCLNTGSLTITWTAEYFSGSISVKVDAGSYTVYTGSTNIAVEMGIGSSRVGISQLLGGGIQALGGMLQMASGAIDMGAGAAGMYLTGGLIGGSQISSGLSGIVGGAGNTLSGYAQTVQPAITSAGSMGGMAAIAQSQNATLALIYYPAITDADFEAIYGHPVFKVDTPVLGFCKTRGFSLETNEEAQYISFVNQIMDGGCFIE